MKLYEVLKRPGEIFDDLEKRRKALRVSGASSQSMEELQYALRSFAELAAERGTLSQDSLDMLLHAIESAAYPMYKPGWEERTTGGGRAPAILALKKLMEKGKIQTSTRQVEIFLKKRFNANATLHNMSLQQRMIYNRIYKVGMDTL